MDAITASLIGTGIGAFAGISGVIIGNFLNRKGERRKWLREKKEEAYSNVIKNILRIKHKRSKITADGTTYLEQSHIKELFDEIASVKYGLLQAEIYASKSFKSKISRLNSEVDNLLRTRTNMPIERHETDDNTHISVAKPKNNLFEDLNRILNVITECAKKDLLE